MESKGTVLLVEDNKDLNDANTQALKLDGYSVLSAETIKEARELIGGAEPDVILLDVMLPDGDGFDFCEEIRNKTKAHIIFLTAKTAHEDMVRGLKGGGDNYITKPFHSEEMLVKVGAAIRRRELDKIPPDTHQTGNITLEIIAGRAIINSVDLMLTKQEFSLLLALARNEGKAMSVDELYQKAWGQPMCGEKRALQKRVSELKNKLQGGKCSHAINTVYGTGYCFEKIES